MEKDLGLPIISNTNLISDDEIEKDDNILIKQVIEPNKQKILMLMSGGIDSPVASYMLIRAGYFVDFIHFTTDIDKINNIIDIKKILGQNNKLFVVNFKNIQEEIVKTCKESYRTIMYKVFMVLIANKIADTNYVGLATGNALGQVASQTISNIHNTNLVSKLPIISPLFSYNKNDIIKIDIEIGTYKPSICDGTNDCCVMYMPKHPVINSKY